MDVTFLSSLDTYLEKLPDFLWNIMVVGIAIIVGFILTLIIGLLYRAFNRGADNGSFSKIVVKRFGGPFNFLLPLLLINLFAPYMRLNPVAEFRMERITEVLMCIIAAYMLIRGARLMEDFVYAKYNVPATDTIRSRKLRTQVQFVRKFLVLVILIVALALILLSFQSLRKLGTSLLAGVGISSIIIGFAAQKSLGNLLAGFQIAFTQPIRIDDIVFIENEMGRIEEITLTYVVVQLWDNRSLILPITFFIEKSFYNWTRKDTGLKGTIFIPLDYAHKSPIEELRRELHRLLDANPLWDKQSESLLVTDSKDTNLIIRAVVSASNASDLFDLRCAIREGLILFLQKNFPESLPSKQLGENA